MNLLIPLLCFVVLLLCFLILVGLIPFPFFGSNKNIDTSTLPPEFPGCISDKAKCSCFGKNPSFRPPPISRPPSSTSPCTSIPVSGSQIPRTPSVSTPPVEYPLCFSGGGDFSVASVEGKHGSCSYDGSCLLYNSSFICIDILGIASIREVFFVIKITQQIKGFAWLQPLPGGKAMQNLVGDDVTHKLVPCQELQESIKGVVTELYCAVRPHSIGIGLRLTHEGDTVVIRTDELVLKKSATMTSGRCGDACSISLGTPPP